MHSVFLKLFRIINKNFIIFKQKVFNNNFISNKCLIWGYGSIDFHKNIVIGDYTIIDSNSSFEDRLTTIKDNVSIGLFCYISAGSRLIIREFSLINSYVKILSADHYQDNIFITHANSKIRLHNTYIGVNSMLSTNCIIIGNVKIGHGSIIGAGTIITKDVKPFTIVVGKDQRIIKYFDFIKKKWVDYVENDYLKSDIPDEESYLKRIKENNYILPIHSSSFKYGWLK